MNTSHEPIRLQGSWQDGASSASSPAALYSSGDHLSLTIGDDKAIPLAQGDLKVSPKIGKTARYLTFTGLAGQLETVDHESLDRLCAGRKKGIADFIHTLEHHLLMVVASAIVVIALTFSYFIWGIPAGSKFIANQLPPEILQQASDDTRKILEFQFFESSTLSEKEQQRIRGLISRHSPDFDIDKFYIRDGGSMGANAFALPDGSVIFTDQIITLADGNDAEILGVFGHELGHIQHRHSLRQLIQRSGISVTIALISGDVSALGDIVMTLPIVFSQLSFSRRFELESDTFGANYLVAHGYDPNALANILQKLHNSHKKCADGDKPCQGEKSNYQYLSTHPYIKDRIEIIHAASQ